MIKNTYYNIDKMAIIMTSNTADIIVVFIVNILQCSSLKLTILGMSSSERDIVTSRKQLILLYIYIFYYIALIIMWL